MVTLGSLLSEDLIKLNSEVKKLLTIANDGLQNVQLESDSDMELIVNNFVFL